MNEKRFIKGYHTIRDTKENKTYDFRVDIICNLLNELDENWINEFALRETLQQELQRIEVENEELKQILGFLKNDNTHDIVGVLNWQQSEMQTLKKENELLKKELSHIKYRFTEYRNMTLKEIKELEND